MGTTMTSQLCPPPMLDRTISRYSNTASAPLPIIPRRTPSVARSQSYPSSSKTTVKVHPPTPPPDGAVSSSQDSDTGTSSVSGRLRPTIAPRSRNVRGQRFHMPSPAVPSSSTPFHVETPVKKQDIISDNTSSSRASDGPSDSDSPQPSSKRASSDPLRLELGSLHTGHSSKSSGAPSVEAPSALRSSINIPPDIEAKLIRKKSGQLVKSSLKSTKSQDRASLSVVARAIASKSEPTTPTHTKAVHFDSRLEHVKFFLAEQKPLAVSRDGSPTTDTSGTDNDFPSFIYGGSTSDKARDKLIMNVVNMPAEPHPWADVVLVELKLSEDMMNILGSVRVRNIAYQKWIAVRFTFDHWQTTSEVTAKHSHAFRGGVFDMFTFTIRLNDIFARIEEKTLIMALRYTVQGREIWDNNAGKNYLARFTKLKPKGMVPTADDESSGSDIADLKTRLEDFANGKEGLHLKPAVQNNKPPALKEVTSLSSRYDLSASFKSSWCPPAPPASLHLDIRSSLTSTRNSIPWPQKGISANDRKPPTLSLQKKSSEPSGSPRDIDYDDYSWPLARVESEVKEFPFHRSRVGRNHQRSYFNISPPYDTGDLRRTPPGTPLVKSAEDKITKPSSASVAKSDGLLPADDAFYPPANRPSMGRRRDSGDNEGSTPPIVSPSSSSRSPSPSPTESFINSCLTGSRTDSRLPSDASADYSQFLNKFCFYTGSGNLSGLDAVPDMPTRSLSASSIDTFPSTPTQRYSDRCLSPFPTPLRARSFDETVYRSGSSTPTANFASRFQNT